MHYEGLPKERQLEIKLYEILKIRFFQKMVFRLETQIHKRDGGYNQNYHFSTKENNFSEHFIQYLFYNGTIHVRNIVYLNLYFIIKLYFFSFHWYDMFLLFLGIKDLYCIMLQRYNFLRIRNYQIIYEKKREKKIHLAVSNLAKNVPVYDPSHKEQDLLFIKRLKQCYLTNNYTILDASDLQTLKRLNQLKKYVNQGDIK